MSDTELNPSSPLQHGSLAAPNTHTLSEDGHLASVIDNLTLEDKAMCKSPGDGRRDPSPGEHDADDNNPSPSPRETLEESPIADDNESARPDAAVDVPDLPKPAHHTTLQADGELSPVYEIGGQETAAMTFQPPGHPATPPQDYVNDCFSLTDVPTLQTFIPDNLLPDDLLVYDPHNITKYRRHRSQCSPHVPVRYVRVFPNLETPRQPFLPFYFEIFETLKAAPEPPMPPQPAFLNRSPHDPPRVAHLYLKGSNSLGRGSHSSVFSAPLRLRLDPASEEESTVRVAAKTARGLCGAHKMLHIEACVYDAFPRHLMDDRYVAGTAAAPTETATQPPLGPQVDTPTTATPSECSSTSNAEGPEGPAATRCVEPAVVPKFYGYYAAADPDGNVYTPMHMNCSPDAGCAVSWPTHILLMEECGKPITPKHATQEQNLHCLQLIKRLHAAGFAQNSMHTRNIVMQPGPLAAPPAARSYATPSFRIIDFGRGAAQSHIPPLCHWILTMTCEEEEREAHHMLELCQCRVPKSERTRAPEPRSYHLDRVLCNMYEGLLSLHWSKLGRRWDLLLEDP